MEEMNEEYVKCIKEQIVYYGKQIWTVVLYFLAFLGLSSILDKIFI